jgi:hypothetical protein
MKSKFNMSFAAFQNQWIADLTEDELLELRRLAIEHKNKKVDNSPPTKDQANVLFAKRNIIK